MFVQKCRFLQTVCKKNANFVVFIFFKVFQFLQFSCKVSIELIFEIEMFFTKIYFFEKCRSFK